VDSALYLTARVDTERSIRSHVCSNLKRFPMAIGTPVMEASAESHGLGFRCGCVVASAKEAATAGLAEPEGLERSGRSAAPASAARRCGPRVPWSACALERHS
jgi:hypothetical protein